MEIESHRVSIVGTVQRLRRNGAVILSERARPFGSAQGKLWRASRKPALSEVEGDLYSKDVA